MTSPRWGCDIQLQQDERLKQLVSDLARAAVVMVGAGRRCETFTTVCYA